MPGTRHLTLLALAAVLMAAAGCSSSAEPHRPVTQRSSPQPTSAQSSTYPGETAATIAGLIPGCADVQPMTDTDGTNGAPSSAASCTLNGRKVWINSYPSTRDSNANGVLEADKAETYWLLGNGWSVLSADSPIVELQLTNQAGALLRYQLSEQTPPPPDIPGQLASMQAVRKALGGTIYHVLANGTSELVTS